MFQKIIIASFSLKINNKRTAINGMIDSLLFFFGPKVNQIDLIDGSHPGSSTILTEFETYKNNQITEKNISLISKLLSPFLLSQNQNGTQIFFKIRDIFSVIEMILRKRKRYDAFIGLESIYALMGIILKKIGIVKMVIYYVSDFSPTRYNQKVLNNIYLNLDRFCCYNADFVWDVSPAMLPARIAAGLNKKKCKKIILVPNALFPRQILKPNLHPKPNSLVFSGTFGEENGSFLAIESIVYVKKFIPQVNLNFIGGNPEMEQKLFKYAEKLNVEKNIFFHGFFSDANKVSKLTQKFMIGLAPYKFIPGSPRLYADATKIRLYAGIGIPIITTQVPPLGKEIEKRKAGFIVKDNAEQIGKAIIKLLSNKKLYEEMKKNSINFGKNNTWENTYKVALSEMKIRI